MIGSKAKSHANFSSLIGYQLGDEKCSGHVTNNLFAGDPAGIAKEMRLTVELANKGRREHEKIQTPTYHISFSWHREDRPTKEQMLAVGKKFLTHMGLEDYQSVIALHRDTPHPHIHVVANRVHPAGGELWQEWKWKDGANGKKVCEATHHQRVEKFERTMEKEYGWRVDPGRHFGEWNKEFDGRAAQPWEIHKEADKKALAAEGGYDTKRADFRTPKVKADELKESLFKARSFAQFDDILARNDLWLDKRGQGIVITDGYDAVAGSHVSRAFSKGNLEQRFGQDFKSYSSQREAYISPSVGGRMATKALSLKLILELQQVRAVTKQELRGIQHQLWAIEASADMRALKEAISGGFAAAYRAPERSFEAFLRYGQSEGTFEAYEKLSEDPQHFGPVKDPQALNRLSGQLRRWEQRTYFTGTYIESLFNKDHRKGLVRGQEKKRAASLNLTRQIAMIKGQANRVMVGMLSETEAGKDLLKLNQSFRRNTALVHKIIAFHRSLQMLSKGRGPQFTQQMMQSVGIQGSAIALGSLQTCLKMVIRRPEKDRSIELHR